MQISNYSNFGLSGYSSSRIADDNIASKENASNATNINATKNEVKSDAVILSDAAKTYLQASTYSKYMPTRDGYSSANLALGVKDPSAEPFSQKRPLAEVANAARENLNQKYQSMKQSGKPYNFDSLEGVDSNSAFGELDRRALFAIKENIGGQFSKQEQDLAQSFMSNQEGLAMGLYSGPSRLEGDFTDSFGGDYVARFKAYEAFLDKVPADEKASGDWIMAKDSAKRGLQSIIDNEKYRKEHKEERGFSILDIITEIKADFEKNLETRAKNHENDAPKPEFVQDLVFKKFEEEN